MQIDFKLCLLEEAAAAEKNMCGLALYGIPDDQKATWSV